MENCVLVSLMRCYSVINVKDMWSACRQQSVVYNTWLSVTSNNFEKCRTARCQELAGKPLAQDHHKTLLWNSQKAVESNTLLFLFFATGISGGIVLSSHLARQESFGENHKRTSWLIEIPAEKSARCCATKDESKGKSTEICRKL